MPQPQYVHVPLVVNAKGERLAKRDGAVTLREMMADNPGATVADVVGQIAASLGIGGACSVNELLEKFDPDKLLPENYMWI